MTTETETKHTPLPWRADPDSGCVFGPEGLVAVPYDGRDRDVDIGEIVDANAEYIVQASNAYPALLAAAEAALDKLTPKHIREYIDQYPTPEQGWFAAENRLRVIGPENFDPGGVIRALLQIRAAIALTEGGAS